MKEETPEGEPAIPAYSSTLSRPHQLLIKYLPKGQAEVVRQMQNRIRELHRNGLKSVNIYNAWLGRHLPPLRTRTHLMCEYKGKNDLTRVCSTEWSEEEYEKALS
jgi:hypothetical protein